MTSKLSDRKCRILVVDPNGSVRTMIADALRNLLSYEQIEGKATVQDALQHLEVDQADWIILGALQADQPINAMHLLKLCNDDPELKHVRISMFLEPDERYVLPTAFELGLLSWHPKPFNKDVLGEEAKKLHGFLQADGWREPITAARYLRAHLKEQKNFEAQLALEKSLNDLYPGIPELLINLAEPYCQLGRQDDARRVLSTVKIVDPARSEVIDAMCKELLGGDLSAAPASGAPATGLLGIKTAVVIDSDSAVVTGVTDLMKELGCAEVHGFADGSAAWAWLDANPEPDLIVLEWRIPKTTGPMLIQRIRQKEYLKVPIVVLSSLLKPDDMPLAKEIGLANIIQKPLNKQEFIPGIVWTLQQERLPTEYQTIERKIRQLLRMNKLDEAEALRAGLASDKSVPAWRKRYVDAEFAYARADYPLAKTAAAEALRHANDSIVILNLLGKTFMRLKNHESALKCFQKAQEMAPNNIERLCNMAESQSELGMEDQAKETLADAKDLDPDNKGVNEAQVKIAITKGDTASAMAMMNGMESIENIVAYMNNKAVAYAKCGHTHDAIALYKKTIQSIPEDRIQVKAVVTYNLALAQIRESEFEAAIAKLDSILKMAETKVKKKAKSLRDRLKLALDKGQDFKLKQSENGDIAKGDQAAKVGSSTAPAAVTPTPEAAPADPGLMTAVEARRGDMCCYLIFISPQERDVRVTALLAKPPRFQRRKAIERSEAMGVERVVKVSA